MNKAYEAYCKAAELKGKEPASYEVWCILSGYNNTH